MTSNQIAFAELQEQRRHQPIVEAETERHNKAMESLQQDANTINAEKVRNESWYQRESLRINKQLAENKLAWEVASGKRKLELEAEANQLRSRANDITDSYNIRSNELRAQENTIKADTLNEANRHNLNMERIEDSKVASSFWYNSMLLDYNERKLQTESGLRREEIELARDRLGADVAFNVKKLEQNQTQMEILSSQIGAQIMESHERVKWLPFDVFFRGVGSASRLFN